MKCPMDAEVELVMSERQGVEIDYCPTCRGVWLDRGELDKILDRAAAPLAAPEASARASHAGAALPYGDPRSDRRYDEPRHDDRSADPRYDPRSRDDRDRPGYKKKRKESWLGDILDFG